jgi:hypothetical protein
MSVTPNPRIYASDFEEADRIEDEVLDRIEYYEGLATKAKVALGVARENFKAAARNKTWAREIDDAFARLGRAEGYSDAAETAERVAWANSKTATSEVYIDDAVGRALLWRLAVEDTTDGVAKRNRAGYRNFLLEIQ